MTAHQPPAASRQPLVVLLGPTAVGKTALSLQLAERLDGNIISADSRLFYRGMEIGTAKPTPAERARAPHYLIDVTTVDRPWSLAQFKRAAAEAIAHSHKTSRLPLLVGGTGQYIRAVVEGWDLPQGTPDAALRDELEAFARQHGAGALHARLRELNPAAAGRIDARNVRRVVRALEVALTSPASFSQGQARSGSPYRVLQVGLTRPRPELYARIDARIREMFAAGLVAEVRALAAQGYDWNLPAMSAIGYRQVGAYLRGEITLAEAERQMQRATRRFVRMQANWFRTGDPSIRWFNAAEDAAEAIETAIRRWLAGE